MPIFKEELGKSGNNQQTGRNTCIRSVFIDFTDWSPVRVLVLNSGSSSLKFRVFDVAEEGPSGRVYPLSGGSVTGIGGLGCLSVKEAGSAKMSAERPVRDHREAAEWLLPQAKKQQIEAVGHRVVHGGERFRRPIRLTDTVLQEIEQLSELAPLHNPACVAAIRGAQAELGGDIPMVGVFDTAFHTTMPAVSSAYALPAELALRHRVRRYGFHGIAHRSLVKGYAAATGKSLADTKLITLHLGNGCSATAIRSGQSVDTSMGMTPLEGLVMGTRSGDLDPAVVAYVARKERVGAETVEQWLNDRSGLLGISELSKDVRSLLKAEANGDTRAALALDLFCYRARKYIGAYLAVLNGADAVVFGGGIGENSPVIRARICAGMQWCGLTLDRQRNEAAVGLAPEQSASIGSNDAGLPAFVVAVDEETTIAQETVRCLRSVPPDGT